MSIPSTGLVRVEEDIVFGQGGGRELRCDVFTPPEPIPGAPAILLIHGGSWVRGDRRQLRGYGFLWGRAGYVCVATEYRLSTEAQWPAQLHDVKAALRWMRANSTRLGIDPERIAVSGNSSGAHLALMLAGTQGIPEFEGDGGHPEASSTVAAAVSYYGVTDIQPGGDFLQEALEALLRSDAKTYREASPLSYVRSSHPPTLLMHSNQDTTIPRVQSLRMYEALIAAKVPVELHMFDGVDHMFDAGKVMGHHSAEIVRVFLDRHMPGDKRSDG